VSAANVLECVQDFDRALHPTCPVVGLFGNHPSNASAWIGSVTRLAGYRMSVEMADGLPGGPTAVGHRAQRSAAKETLRLDALHRDRYRRAALPSKDRLQGAACTST